LTLQYASMATIGVVFTAPLAILSAWFCTLLRISTWLSVVVTKTSVPYSRIGRTCSICEHERVDVGSPGDSRRSLHQPDPLFGLLGHSLKVRLSGELLVQGNSKIDQIFFLSDLPSVDEEFQGWVCMLEGENGVETIVRVDLEAVLLVPPNGSSHGPGQ
jgi:hypothetical protein